MRRLPKLQLHRNGLLALAGILLLIMLVGAVWTVAVLRVIMVVAVIVAFVEIVVHLVRRRELRAQSRLFDSQSTFNAIRKPRKSQ
jgi:Flp pilus assembly protein TadB